MSNRLHSDKIFKVYLDELYTEIKEHIFEFIGGMKMNELTVHKNSNCDLISDDELYARIKLMIIYRFTQECHEWTLSTYHLHSKY